ncbi:M16 family metallopeptidase [Plesiocystis pacifica]|uniref:M16 family metallopeptidase n=1 Tax=Plesiocystis pacifica TaxID=191768 RepID=UPI0012F74DE1|nr:insulinase family protein [Plesiocystis pacifica]
MLLGGCGTPASFVGSEHEPPTTPETITVTFPPIARHEFGGDAQLYMLEDRSSPLVSLGVCIQAGFADDPVNKEGLARLVVSCMRRSGGGHLEGLTTLGAELSSRLRPQSIGLRCTVERKYAAQALALLVRGFSKLDRDPALFERERNAQLELLGAMRSDPRSLGGHGIVFASLPVAPASRSLATGCPESVASISHEDFLRWVDAHLRPSRLSFALAGNLSLDEAKSWAIAAATGWTVATRTPASPTPPVPIDPDRHGAVLTPLPGMQDVILSYGGTEAPYGARDRVLIETANSFVASFINRKLRTHLRAAYGVDWQAWQTRSEIVTQYFAPVTPEALAPAIQGCRRQLEQLQDDPQIRRRAGLIANENRLAQYVAQMRRYETTSAACGQLLNMADVRLPVERAYRELDQLYALDGSKIASVISERFAPEKMRWSVVGPPEAIERAAGSFGAAKVVRRTVEGLVG